MKASFSRSGLSPYPALASGAPPKAVTPGILGSVIHADLAAAQSGAGVAGEARGRLAPEGAVTALGEHRGGVFVVNIDSGMSEKRERSLIRLK